MPTVTITSSDATNLFWRLVFVEALGPASTTELLSIDEEIGLEIIRIKYQ